MSKSKQSQLYSLITVFFFWGFLAASNGILIPYCKTHFNLNQFGSQLIDFTFYGGYFIGSLLLFLYGLITKSDLLNKIGFRKGIVIGLLISMVGSFAIIPAVQSGYFAFLLTALFIVALGFSLQQTAAQPFAVSLGTPETGAHRLNLAGGINSLGTTVGPVIVGYLLFGKLGSTEVPSIQTITRLFWVLGGLFAALALFFNLSGKSNSQELNNDSITDLGALKHPQLVMGMLAIFLYVGVEVSIQSNLGALLSSSDFGQLPISAISPFISLYWGSLMIGRWTGAVNAFGLSRVYKNLLMAVMPLIAFGVVLFINAMNGHPFDTFLVYIIPILIMIGINFIAGENQVNALILFSLYGVVAMIVGLFTKGDIALYAFISGGLACSVLWPCIFSVAIHGLGKYTSQGSSFLIMMIVGGAIIPPIQGYLADIPSIGIHMSYIVTVFCFAYLVMYGLVIKKLLLKNGTHSLSTSLGH